MGKLTPNTNSLLHLVYCPPTQEVPLNLTGLEYYFLSLSYLARAPVPLLLTAPKGCSLPWGISPLFLPPRSGGPSCLTPSANLDPLALPSLDGASSPESPPGMLAAHRTLALSGVKA